jgi:hypothetical protein
MSSSVDPQPNTYMLGTIFNMPTEGGSTIAIAVEKRTGDNLISLYSVLVTLMFIPTWKLAAVCARHYFYHDVEKLRKPEKPWDGGVVKLLATFAMPWQEAAGLSDEPKSTKESLAEDRGRQVALFVFSMCFFFGSMIAGILVPPLLVIGTVAPVHPSAIYFPGQPLSENPAEGLKYQALKAPAAVRAVGGVGAAKSRGGVDMNLVSISTGDDPVVQIDYKYQVTGLDFGLQKLSQLVQTVQGRCITEYSWISPEANATGDYEYYRLWNLPSEVVSVAKNQSLDPPWATMHRHRNTEQTTLTGNNSYAVVVHSAGRLSYSASSDPWYSTQVASGDASLYSGGYEVRRGRPPLSCWQKDMWSFGSQTVDSVFHLNNLTGLDLPLDWDNFLRIQFAAPKLIDIGISLGRSSLVSSTTYLDRITAASFDAASSKLFDDMERLIWTAYVSSRDIFRESTMVVERYNIPNAVTGGDERVAQFVLTTSAVSTLSLAVLITVPVVCVVLWVLRLVVV